ncbi:MAG: hypothetical protein NZ527_05260 [Hydrogenobacter thermophilus]|uniref:hypothetical protein n=1 Tax=Hydrogenobacter thermophilus TaxID=940 RepID=UPI00059E86D6|nr:hypothetical protein [Hydrogenobacter thermophilus]MCS7285110.1 hypothetical protein [Hydrogenobacter thermophilus]QWK20338.1 MAG: hypothetical protein KNN13_03145 [Hydrogenobacter thermophilus]
MVERPLPEEIKQKILQKVKNKALAQKAFEYVRLVEKEDGTVYVKEEFDNTDHHALWFMVLAVVNYAQRLLRGEDIDDI